MDTDIPSTGIAAQGLGKPALQLDCLGLDSVLPMTHCRTLSTSVLLILLTRRPGIILTPPSPPATPDG